ncbi:hypothetical protein BDV95DRAFT_600257 [Massariosphaeria phaeospora]|uniref:F-box domain-containing protein n=1 Tax=Massariosphaeria phaeospora TaxID=100035 RepID=A0A7C8HYC0_9PLEO|nr:hypothetical protein BDV95DRAFT_600257 [Massariosphaeria phaeospora]
MEKVPKSLPEELPGRSGVDDVPNCECLGRENCDYVGRSIEPLAFSIPLALVSRQDACPLFTQLPLEIREMIYTFALADTTSNPIDWDNPFRTGHTGDMPKSDIAMCLLQTCRAVYLEAYKLPLLLNPLIVYAFDGDMSYSRSRPDITRLAPWQIALIQRLDISLRQIRLETGELARYLEAWGGTGGLRHQGAYVAPRYYHHAHRRGPGRLLGMFDFRPMPVETTEDIGDGAEVTLDNAPFDDKNGFVSKTTIVRAMVARPLTHLTVRLSRTDWWHWASDPNPTDPLHQISLDPALGCRADDLEYPTPPRMLQAAAQRRAGQFPNPCLLSPAPTRYQNTWGAAIAKQSQLRTLEFVLEMFEEKKGQLEVVVECAKSWRFAMDGVAWELVWDGQVEEKRWKSCCRRREWDCECMKRHQERQKREEEGQESEEEWEESDDSDFDSPFHGGGYHRNIYHRGIALRGKGSDESFGVDRVRY